MDIIKLLQSHTMYSGIDQSINQSIKYVAHGTEKKTICVKISTKSCSSTCADEETIKCGNNSYSE